MKNCSLNDKKIIFDFSAFGGLTSFPPLDCLFGLNDSEELGEWVEDSENKLFE